MNCFPRSIVKNKGTEIAEKYITDNPRLSYETLHDMSDENIESILKMYLKDDIKCHFQSLGIVSKNICTNDFIS